MCRLTTFLNSVSNDLYLSFFQVKYLQSCISVCVDFVSPENLSHSCHLVRQFRFLSETQQPAPEDRFQVKNLVFHSVKKALSVREKNRNKRIGKVKQKNSFFLGVKNDRIE